MTRWRRARPGLLSSGEVARILNVHPATVSRWVRSGRLVSCDHTDGGHARFDPDYVTGLAERQREATR